MGSNSNTCLSEMSLGNFSYISCSIIKGQVSESPKKKDTSDHEMNPTQVYPSTHTDDKPVDHCHLLYE